ncbi:KaiA family protein [Sphaerospermopsis aphanizomenoides BCCUSP55]|uniref:KaiA family protein n=1 Tax=Sphaerospermopsis aphanizomenoides TaxID=459663 RepID=UPI001906EE1D|nr:KaiA family protein [Sphaerospermopsis aphanizomenoides]MBK1986731.1 KaiA family protein [Sphaerospermopsis aphanizomenoides BCCUSP55]
MILPILLIWLPDVKKSLYSITPGNQQQRLIGKLGNVINDIVVRMWGLPLTATIAVKSDYLPNGRQLNTNSTNDNEQYSYVLACNQQKNQQWFQKMSPADKQELLEQLKSDYRQILINYFLPDKTLKTTIDKFINALFYANIPVPQIIEIHMELIEEFSKQLKLEGRSDETLLDYRLTLIDILAHLCEVYRISNSKIN